MHVLILSIEIHIPAAQSLKSKRSVVLSLVRQLDQMHGVGAAEVDHLDVWQRSTIGVTVVGGDVGHVESVADAVDRLVWSKPELEVITIDRSWWDNAS